MRSQFTPEEVRILRRRTAHSRKRIKPLVILATAVIALTSALADDCDQQLVQQIAVRGLDPRLLYYPVSSLAIPTFGFATADMSKAIDAVVGNYMNKSGAAGGTVAMTYRNRLIFAKSYGWADVGNAVFAEPDSRLRIASVTKPITTMGILKLNHDATPTLVTPQDLQLIGPDWPLRYQPFSGPGFVLLSLESFLLGSSRLQSTSSFNTKAVGVRTTRTSQPSRRWNKFWGTQNRPIA
jgi:hypothetical protein